MWLTTVVLTAYVLLGQRLVLVLPEGSRLPVLLVCFLLLTATLTMGMRKVSARSRAARSLERLSAPLILLLLVLPVGGVLYLNYEIPTLFSWIVALYPVAVWVFVNEAVGIGMRSAILRASSIMIGVHGIFGLLQYLRRIGSLPPVLGDLIYGWDVASQRASNPDYVITGRSIGLFLNANIFGVWSVLAVVFAFRFYSGATRLILLSLAVGGVAVSQSRTAFVTPFVVALIGVVHAARRRGRLLGLLVGGFLLVPTALFVMTFASERVNAFVEQAGLNRVLSGLGVITGGIESDTNLAARVNAWSGAWEFMYNSNLPFGTLGPPQVLYQHYIDNQLVWLSAGLILPPSTKEEAPMAQERKGLQRW